MGPHLRLVDENDRDDTPERITEAMKREPREPEPDPYQGLPGSISVRILRDWRPPGLVGRTCEYVAGSVCQLPGDLARHLIAAGVAERAFPEGEP